MGKMCQTTICTHGYTHTIGKQKESLNWSVMLFEFLENLTTLLVLFIES